MGSLGLGLDLALRPRRSGSSVPTETIPASFTITYSGNNFGDSTTFGVGAPSGMDLPSRMRLLVSSGPAPETFHLNDGDGAAVADGVYSYYGNGGYSGKNTTTIAGHVTNIKVNYPAEITGRVNFFSGGLNDYNSVVSGWARDWPAQVKTNFATMAAQTGALDYFFDLAPHEMEYSRGTAVNADHIFHRREMRSIYGRRANDQSAYLKFRNKLSNPAAGTADYAAILLGSAPYSSYGYPTASGDFADGNPAITVQASAPTAGSAGTDGAIIWATTPRNIWRCGAGGWQLLDTKHRGRVGNDRLAQMRLLMQTASEGTGAPYTVPDEMRVAADAPAGTAVGQLLYTGAATSFLLLDYSLNQVEEFAISATGEVTRAATGTLTEGMAQLVVAATNSHGTRYSPLDIYVTRPSAVTAPQMRTITAGTNAIDATQSGGVSLGTRWTSMADTTAMSFAFWLNPAAVTSAYLCIWQATRIPIYIQISSGNLRCVIKNSASSTTFADSTVKLVANTAKWVFIKVNGSGFQYYFNDTDVSPATASTGGTFEFASASNNASGVFLSSANPKQGYEPPNSYLGGIGFIGAWDVDIDWSVQATRRQLMNADFTPVAGRTPFSAVGGTAPKIEMWGGLGDWLYGTPDGSNGPQTLSLSASALTRMT